MRYPDLHMHSALSFDSDTPRDDMVRAALDAGLSTICFTEHYDVLDEGALPFKQHCDFSAIARQHRAELRAVSPDRLEILSGLELGNAPLNLAESEQVLETPGLDFVIGSLHNTSRALQCQDYYEIHYTSPEYCYTVLDDYFAHMLELARWGRTDILGHIPYPLRYMRDRDGNDVSLDRYEDILREILTLVIRAGHGIEVNTNKGGSYADYAPLLALYRELGGEIVTVGADAHTTAHVGCHIRGACEMIRAAGFRYLTVFRDRKPCPLPLED